MPISTNPEARPSLPTKKRHSAQTRASKPILATSTKRTTPSRVHHRPSSSRGSTESNIDNEEQMATTFQQFCASCDKQMIVHNASILYCSERCRRHDAPNLSIPLYKTDISPPISPFSTSTFDSFPIRDIVPQRSPTTYSPSRPSMSGSIGSAQSSSNDLNDKRRRPSVPRSDSEAAKYLAQFGSGSSPRDHARPRMSRSSTANPDPAPSLSNTPTSYASASSNFSPQQSLSYSQRPLQTRSNPRWSGTSFSSRSVDLVTPISHGSSMITLTDTTGKEQPLSPKQESNYETGGYKISYEKRPGLETIVSPGRSSLKQLFAFDEMRAQPADTQQRPESRDGAVTTSHDT